MQKLKQTEQKIDWADWKKLKAPFWYKRITDALPIYNKYSEDIAYLFTRLGKADVQQQRKLIEKMELLRLKAIKDVDKMDHTFLNDLYQCRLLYIGNQQGFKPENISTMLKDVLKPIKKSKPKQKQKRKTKKRKNNEV